MNRLAARVSKLEDGGQSGPPWWAGLPFDEWPSGAVLVFIGASEGWPAGHEPSEAEWRGLLGDDSEGGAAW